MFLGFFLLGREDTYAVQGLLALLRSSLSRFGVDGLSKGKKMEG